MNYTMKTIDKIELNKILEDILNNEIVLKMKDFNQHFDTSCYDHCYGTAYYCYIISKKFNWDYKSVARAAMLHDLFLYDWRKRDNNRKGLHAFTHGKTACINACKIFDLSEKEKDIIKKHMFPVTPIPPKSKEGLLLTFVDKYCALLEFKQYIYEKYLEFYGGIIQ